MTTGAATSFSRTRKNMQEYFEKLNEYLLPYDLKRMTRMQEEKMFIDDVRRKN